MFPATHLWADPHPPDLSRFNKDLNQSSRRWIYGSPIFLPVNSQDAQEKAGLWDLMST